MHKIRNIIFDLGGVILNIDLKQSELAFAELGLGNFNEYYTLQSATPLFQQLEAGMITPETFFNEFRRLAKIELTNEQIKVAWNALLLDFPAERIKWLKQISKRYNIYLLSNTNQIHYDAFINTFKKEFNEEFNGLFIKTYYSHQLGLRKPSKEIFETVLKNENLNVAETVFIDDSDANISAANAVGLQTIYLRTPKTILELDL
ncbi:MAG: HAD family phosphatase [Parafilimonas sp.]|nr:HAD family phosphatase [Parafilimonas sp.]